MKRRRKSKIILVNMGQRVLKRGANIGGKGTVSNQISHVRQIINTTRAVRNIARLRTKVAASSMSIGRKLTPLCSLRSSGDREGSWVPTLSLILTAMSLRFFMES